jgi:hypothetical protein
MAFQGKDPICSKHCMYKKVTEAKYFSSSLCVQTSSEANPASYPVGAGCPLTGGKARLGHDADFSRPSSTDVKNE